ncbi:MAG: NADH-quinone oxidoreductase subunit A [Candidatus Kariarchaeaceae archaeon]|jgi:NADH:ubiquinone oxidoreductase subunit 3 (subunit A)
MAAFILQQYLSAFILFNLGVITVIIFVLLNKFLAPKRDESKQIEGLSAFIAYECGEVPIGDAQTRFNFQYYVFALIFVIFDVVTSFLLAWALSVRYLVESYEQIMGFAGAFLGVLLIGFLYWWKRDALRWM